MFGINRLAYRVKQVYLEIRCLNERMCCVAKTLDEVLSLVSESNTVQDSLIVLVKGIKAQLDEVLAGNLSPENQAKVDAIFASVEEQKAETSEAVTENTPQAPVA